MRLTICFGLALLLHLLLFDFSFREKPLPTLAISLKPNRVDLQIRQLPKKKKETPLVQKPEEKSKPKPPPPKKPVPAKEQLAPKRKQEEIEKKNAQEKNEEYISQELEKPRMIKRAEYLSNPAPKYPDVSRRRRQEGVVTLLVEIDARGFVSKLQIQKSSGFSALDEAAEKAVSTWRFSPAEVSGRQQSSKVLVPVSFKLSS